jgi:hypothetical protein
MNGNPPPPSTSATLLEELRQRIRSEIAPPPPSVEERLATFGRGVLSNRGSFLDNLSAGLAAQNEAEVARAERQRRNLEIERGITEAASREALERDRRDIERRGLDLRERELAQQGRPQYTVVGQDARGNAIVMDPRNPSQRITLEGVTPMQVANLNARTDVANRQLATRLAEAALGREIRARADASLPVFTEAQLSERRRQLQAEILESMGVPQSTGDGASTTAGGAQPSRVIDYGGPAAQPAPRSGPRIAP